MVLQSLEGKANTFNYRFNYNASYQTECDLRNDPAYGVPHAAELPFVFGMPTYLTNPTEWCNFTHEDQRVADHIGSLWGALVRNDTSGIVSEWPRYTKGNQVELLLDKDIKRELYRTTFSDMWLDILYSH